MNWRLLPLIPVAAFFSCSTLIAHPILPPEVQMSGNVSPDPYGTLSSYAVLTPLIQAGHPRPDPSTRISPDSPDIRIDPNTRSSLFAGIGSVFADNDPSTPLGALGTGTPIDRWHILTAGHVFDLENSDGQVDVLPQNSVFILNYGSDLSHVIRGAEVIIHPDYNPGPNGVGSDDLAILRLSEPLPEEVPVYPLVRPEWLGVDVLTMVGYGQSGDGINGYTEPATFNIKRVGGNLLEAREFDDEGGPEVELVAWDFEYEGDPDRYNVFGISYALPNQVETTLGSGDSGGPSFMRNPTDRTDPTLYLAVVNTFSFVVPGQPDHDEPGKFGSGSGGIWLNAEYQAWIAQVRSVPDSADRFSEVVLVGLALLAAGRFRRADNTQQP